jgi:hypothetical protein
MARREHLGEFEQIVLLAILRLGEEAYGVPIREEIERRTGRSQTVGRYIERWIDSNTNAMSRRPSAVRRQSAVGVRSDISRSHHSACERFEPAGRP